MLHRLQIIGALGKDAEIKQAADKTITTFQVAVDTGYFETTSQQWISRTTWYTCTLWKEVKTERLKKGAMIFIDGEPNIKPYINKDGEACVDMSMKVDKFKILVNAKTN